jgi:TRAP-type C4-dicarboxylate transport system permease small subunit
VSVWYVAMTSRIRESVVNKKLERIMANLFGFVFLGLSVLITIETIVRKLFDVSIQGSAELGGYALAVGSVIGFSLAVMGRNHIRVDVLHERFPRKMQALMNWLSAVTLAALAILFVGVCFRVIVKTIDYGSTAQTPWATPLIYPQAVWYAALILFALFAIVYAVRASKLYFSGDIDTLLEEFHPKSTKEELKEELDDLALRSASGEEK